MEAQKINVNLIPGGVLPRLHVSQYDKGRPIKIELFDSVEKFDIPMSATVTIEGTKKDNTGFQYECFFENNVVSFNLQEQVTVWPGEVESEIVVREDGQRIGTGNFIFWVERAGLQSDVVVSETDIPILQQIPEIRDEVKATAEAAALSETYAKASEEAAALSETNAKASEKAAALSETYAKASEEAAALSETNAKASEEAAALSETNAKASEEAAALSESSANLSELNALNYSDLAKSYAVGTEGEVRPTDATDNSKYYYEQARDIAEGLQGGIIPQGTVAFEDLPPIEDAINGGMYNISNSFVTTDDFTIGAGVNLPAGSNIYKLVKLGVAKWDVFVGSTVLGIKGNKEATYRKGEVNLTPADIGSPTIEQIGDEDISEIGDGTVKGAISRINTDLSALNIVVSGKQNKLTTITTTVTVRHGTSSGTLYLRKYGNVVFATMILVTNVGIADHDKSITLAGTIPSEYRPKLVVYVPALLFASNYVANRFAKFNINSNGTITFSVNTEGLYEYHWSTSWVI